MNISRKLTTKLLGLDSEYNDEDEDDNGVVLFIPVLVLELVLVIGILEMTSIKITP